MGKMSGIQAEIENAEQLKNIYGKQNYSLEGMSDARTVELEQRVTSVELIAEKVMTENKLLRIQLEQGETNKTIKVLNLLGIASDYGCELMSVTFKPESTPKETVMDRSKLKYKLIDQLLELEGFDDAKKAEFMDALNSAKKEVDNSYQ